MAALPYLLSLCDCVLMPSLALRHALLVVALLLVLLLLLLLLLCCLADMVAAHRFAEGAARLDGGLAGCLSPCVTEL